MTAKQILLSWLAEDNLKKVFQGLFTLADKYRDEELRNNSTFQSGRLKSLEKLRINGTISQEEDHLQTAKIRDALLQIVQGLPEDWILDRMDDRPRDVHRASLRANWKKYAAYTTAAIALLAGIAELSGYSIRDLFEKKDSTEIPAKTLPVPSASTSGDYSPAVITNEGDVNINYGEPGPKKDSTNNRKNPQK